MATQATNPYYLTPDMVQSKEAMRQKMAYALLQQGGSGEPVQAWSQGLARMAQGALGGYELYKDDQEDKAKEAKIAAALDNLPGFGQGQPQIAPPQAQPPQAQAPVQRNPIVAALAPKATATDAPPVAGPRNVPVQPSPKVWGDQEGVDAGLYPPTAFGDRFAGVNPQAQPGAMQPTPVPTERIAQALQPTQSQSQQISPQDQAQIRQLWQNPATRPLALERYQNLSKPKDQDVPLVDPKERAAAGIPASDISPYQRNTANGKISPINIQPNITLNTEKKGQEALATKAVDAYVDAQTASRDSQKRIATYDQMEKAAKAFTPGASAAIKLEAKRWMKDIGLINGEDVPDAEAFKMMQQQLAIHAQPKGQGAVSNFEREMFAKALPNMTMSPEGLGQAIGIHRKLEQFDMKVAEIFRDSARKNGGIPNYLEVQDAIAGLGSPLSDREMNKIKNAGQAPAEEGGWQTISPGVRIREKK